MTDPTRGVLYPERLPRFTRVAPGAAAHDLVAWFWIPEWQLPDGVASRQELLPYPAANLVVEPTGIALWGPATRQSERVLTGSGWAVGALLRPAAFSWLAADPSSLVDRSVAIDDAGLRTAIADVMPGGAHAAAGLLERWLAARVGECTGEARLANAMADILMTDPAVLRVEDAAARLGVSVRTLQRLAHRTVGLPPAAMIRRRRLQEAAQRVREHPGVRLAEVAAELGYSDQAHLAADFRTVLGITAGSYRRGEPGSGRRSGAR